MKQILLLLLLLSGKLYADNGIEKAILKSDPIALKQEIEKYTLQKIPFSKIDQIKYLDLSEEIIIRRRHIVTFPFSPGLTYDKELSAFTVLKLWGGALGNLFCGTIIISIFGQKKHPLIEFGAVLPWFALNGLSAFVFIEGCIELNDHCNQPQRLYENALKVKQLLYDIQEII